MTCNLNSQDDSFSSRDIMTIFIKNTRATQYFLEHTSKLITSKYYKYKVSALRKLEYIRGLTAFIHFTTGSGFPKYFTVKVTVSPLNTVLSAGPSSIVATEEFPLHFGLPSWKFRANSEFSRWLSDLASSFPFC